MHIRNYSNLGLAVGLLAAGVAHGGISPEPLNVMVPVDWTSEPIETQIGELRNMHDRYGLRRFVLIGPWNRQYYRGTDMSDWERLGDDIARAKKELADDDVTRKGGIYEHLLSGGEQESALSIRKFTDSQKPRFLCRWCFAIIRADS